MTATMKDNLSGYPKDIGMDIVKPNETSTSITDIEEYLKSRLTESDLGKVLSMVQQLGWQEYREGREVGYSDAEWDFNSGW